MNAKAPKSKNPKNVGAFKGFGLRGNSTLSALDQREAPNLLLVVAEERDEAVVSHHLRLP